MVKNVTTYYDAKKGYLRIVFLKYLFYFSVKTQRHESAFVTN